MTTATANDNAATFQVGRTYFSRLVGDVRFEITVASRKGLKVTCADGASFRVSRLADGEEAYYPLGRYSCAPMITAHRVRREA